MTSRVLTSRRAFLTTAAAGAASLQTLPGTARAADPRALEFEAGVVDVGDALLATRSVGRGDLLVIHPSLGRGATDFDRLALMIAQAGYRVVSFDPRGIGRTTSRAQTDANLTLHELAADMLAVIKHYGEGAHVVGHAFGNRVARVLATDRPEATRSVILYACGDSLPSVPMLANIEQAGSPVTPIDQLKQAVAAAFFASGNDPSPWYTGWYPGGMKVEEVANARTQSSEYRAGGTAPMLVVQGLQDAVALPVNGQNLKASYPDRVTLVELDRAGHALIEEQTAKVAAATIDFLERLGPKS